jgi:hypothetical protein
MKSKTYGLEITGHLDIIVSDREDEFEGEVSKWQEVMIHGDPEGLKSFGKLLIKLANLDQEKRKDLPIGAKEHYHLRPNRELSKSSVTTIVGRIDAKGTGYFYDKYFAKDPLEYPEEFQKKLDEMPDLKTAFEALTPWRQRSYYFYFSAPIRSKTREARVERCIPKILNGKSLKDS